MTVGRISFIVWLLSRFQACGHHFISARNSDESATQLMQARRGVPAVIFPVSGSISIPLSSRHIVEPFLAWNFLIIPAIAFIAFVLSPVTKPRMMPAPVREPQVASMHPMPLPNALPILYIMSRSAPMCGAKAHATACAQLWLPDALSETASCMIDCVSGDGVE